MISAVNNVQSNCKQNMASNVNFNGRFMYAGTCAGKIEKDAIEIISKAAGQDGVEALSAFRGKYNVLKDIGHKLGSWWKNFIAQMKSPHHGAVEITKVGTEKGKLYVRHGLNISGLELKGSKVHVHIPENATGEDVMKALEEARELSSRKTNLEYSKKLVNNPELQIQGYPPKAE